MPLRAVSCVTTFVVHAAGSGVIAADVDSQTLSTPDRARSCAMSQHSTNAALGVLSTGGVTAPPPHHAMLSHSATKRNHDAPRSTATDRQLLPKHPSWQARIDTKTTGTGQLLARCSRFARLTVGDKAPHRGLQEARHPQTVSPSSCAYQRTQGGHCRAPTISRRSFRQSLLPKRDAPQQNGVSAPRDAADLDGTTPAPRMRAARSRRCPRHIRVRAPRS
eukprot:ctg_700.g324